MFEKKSLIGNYKEMRYSQRPDWSKTFRLLHSLNYGSDGCVVQISVALWICPIPVYLRVT